MKIEVQFKIRQMVIDWLGSPLSIPAKLALFGLRVGLEICVSDKGQDGTDKNDCIKTDAHAGAVASGAVAWLWRIVL